MQKVRNRQRSLYKYAHSTINDVSGCLTLNGQTPVFRDYRAAGVQGGFGDQTHAISRDLQFSCYGDVTGWAAYTQTRGTFTTIKFQVWRLTQEDMNGCRTYQLVDSHTFNDISTSIRLLNITSLGGQNPIAVQPGDVVGFYGDFSSRNINSDTNIQSNTSTDYVSYYTSPVTSATADALREASTCSDLPSSEPGVPVITAYVTNQGERLLSPPV